MTNTEDTGPSARPGSRYNWRGIRVPETESRIASRIGGVRGAVGRAAAWLGLVRPRLADGTKGPRRWKGVATLAGVAVAVIFVWTTVHVVPPGNRAIPVTLGHPGAELGPGIHLTLPFTVTRNMSVRTEQYTMSGKGGDGTDGGVAVLGRDGGSARIDATVLFRVVPEHVDDVFKQVGTGYVDKIVRPSARACIRSEFTNYDMVAAATTAWHDVEADVAECMRGKLAPRGLELQDFQLREVALGKDVQAAIDGKVAAQQNSERQKFELSRAQQEAEITRVQALATADSQQILACGGEVTLEERDGKPVAVIRPKPIDRCSQAQLTPQYLQFSYIQALKNLVNSPNNSTIILPFDQNLTPLLNVNPDGSASVDGTGGGGG
ncbi:MAG: hypothetical protein KatS3mg009_2086 [Acidimicrobiia bacterium]|nr:MAG: hypothetical protein KatS3mg009_2086 [Acidimicrobiia bacterium]